jgi:hypothetical protein
MKCQERFVIPSCDNPKAKKILEDATTEPVGGFYHEVFVRTWPIFFRLEHVATLVFLFVIVFFKYFLRNVNYSFTMGRFAMNIPIDWIAMFVCWGYIFWFYMATIERTAIHSQDLPEIDVGSGFEFLWTLIKSIYLFIVAFVLAELPFLVIIWVLYNGLGIGWMWLRCLLGLTGLFFAPMLLLAVSSAKEMWMALRPDFIVVPVLKAFGSYVVCAVLMVIAGVLQFLAIRFDAMEGPSSLVVAGQLALNFVAVIAGIVAMRSVGLFFRHYECYFPWK